MKTTDFTLSVFAVGMMAGALCTQVSAFTFDQDPGDDALVWTEDFDNNNKVEFLDAVNFLNCFNQDRQDRTAAANKANFVKSHYKKIYEEWPQPPWGTASSMCQKILNQFKV